MEKKLTNNGPLRELADKHSIYPQSPCSTKPTPRGGVLSATCVLSLCPPVCSLPAPACRHQPFRGARTRNPCDFPLPCPERPVEAVCCRVVPRCAPRRQRHAAGRAGRKCRLYYLSMLHVNGGRRTVCRVLPNAAHQSIPSRRTSVVSPKLSRSD